MLHHGVLAILDSTRSTIHVSRSCRRNNTPAPANILDQIRFLMRRFYAIQLLFWLTLWSAKFSLLWVFRRLMEGLPIYGRIWLGIVIFTARWL
jgi:hypothetical protein